MHIMSMASSHQHRSRCCFLEWMNTQEEDLSELLEALDLNANNDDNSENVYTQLAQKSIDHFQDYIDKRSQMYQEDPSAFFAPAWCTSLENSSLWIAGCRPSSFIRLLYAVGGSNFESLLTEIMQGTSKENLGDLSSNQLTMVNNLHLTTIKEEDKLTSKLASLQEDMADQPICVLARRSSRTDEPHEEVDRALDEHETGMADIIQEADELRLSTLKELIRILSPLQAVDFLAAGKKLHLCIHEWGKRRDRRHGRN